MNRALLLLLASWWSLLGCTNPNRGSAAAEVLPDNPLSVVNHESKPRLTVLRRGGDRGPSVAIAVSHNAPPAEVDSLLGALESSLSKKGYAAEIQRFAHGFTLTLPVGHTDTEALSILRKALLGKRQPRKREPTGSVAFDPCAPRPVTTATATATATALRLGSKNISFAAVGPDVFIDRWLDAYADDAPWPEGTPAYRQWPTADSYVIKRSQRQELWVALRTTTSDPLLGAAESLNLKTGLAQRQLSYLGWKQALTHSSVRPRGGCLALQLRPTNDAGLEDAARAARIALNHMQWALRNAERRPYAEQALTADSTEAAASRSAWHAFHQRESDERSFDSNDDSPRVMVTWRTPHPGDHAELKRQMMAVIKAGVELRTTIEEGQGQVWLALTSQCPLAHENATSAGHTALALQAAATFHSPHAQFQVMTGPSGIGFIASGRALHAGDTERVARAMVEALTSNFFESRAIVAAQDYLAAHRHESPLLDLGATLLTAGHPSQLLQLGTSRGLSTATAERVRTSLAVFLGSPLVLSVLSNTASSQAQRLQLQLSELLSPFRGQATRCPKHPAPTLSGEYGLAKSELPEGAATLLFFPLPPSKFLEARWFAFLASRPGGWLTQALGGEDSAHQRAHAAALGTRGGTAALVIQVDGAAPAPDTVQKLRAALKEQRATPLSAREFELAAVHFKAQREGPVARLGTLASPARKAPTQKSLDQFVQDHLSESKLVIVTPAD